MKFQESVTFSIDNFEGPLDLLWHLISRQEIDIYEVSIKEITKQFIERCKNLANPEVDHGAEFIASAASLLWLKSKTLLPIHEQLTDTTLEEEDPRFEIIHHLMDYCRFKQAAKDLSDREQHQTAYYLRGVESSIEAKKNLGIDHLSLEDLANLFRDIIAKVSVKHGLIHEEVWRVSDKIRALRYQINECKSIPFVEVFTSEKSREELIVTFLALLELMKNGEAKVVFDRTKNIVSIIATSA